MDFNKAKRFSEFFLQASRLLDQGTDLPTLLDLFTGIQAVLERVLVATGAPDPGAPPCMRQRLLPLTAGDMQGLPERVLAPHRGLASIGPVLRG